MSRRMTFVVLCLLLLGCFAGWTLLFGPDLTASPCDLDPNADVAALRSVAVSSFSRWAHINGWVLAALLACLSAALFYLQIFHGRIGRGATVARVALGVAIAIIGSWRLANVSQTVVRNLDPQSCLVGAINQPSYLARLAYAAYVLPTRWSWDSLLLVDLMVIALVGTFAGVMFYWAGRRLLRF
jgi:hypothetical protein